MSRSAAAQGGGGGMNIRAGSRGMRLRQILTSDTLGEDGPLGIGPGPTSHAHAARFERFAMAVAVPKARLIGTWQDLDVPSSVALAKAVASSEARLLGIWQDSRVPRAAAAAQVRAA